MSNNDQALIDHLYNTIYAQQLRCDLFYNGSPINSVWNKYTDEKKILDAMVDKYKTFYKTRADQLKIIVFDIKESRVNSYLTYDIEFYNNLYITQLEEINKFITLVENKTLDSIFKNKFNSISTDIDILFPEYLVSPTLFGLL